MEAFFYIAIFVAPTSYKAFFQMIQRNDKIILRKFWQFMFPALGTAIAISLNEFVDSIIVSQLLGSEAMAIVNVGSPIMLVAASLYALFGFGGSILYSHALGEKKEEKAHQVWGSSMQIAAITSVVIMLLGLAFRAPIATFLAEGSNFYPQLYPYIFYLFASFPLVTLVMSLAAFLPAMNHAILGSSCAIVANAVNQIMDYVFIEIFDQGVSGAAMATLFGYAVAGLIVLILALRKKIVLPCRTLLRKFDLGLFKSIVNTGFSAASLQMGFAIAWVFCITLAAKNAGDDGLIAFSFFFQLSSIMAIIIVGITDGATPIYSLLYGACDKQGIKMLTLRASLILELGSIALVIFFVTCPQTLYRLFDIQTEPQIILCWSSIVSFAIYAPFRSLLVLYRTIMNSCGRIKYATSIAILDSAAGILLYSSILTHFFGVRGLWYAYIANIFTICLGTAIYNIILYFKSKKTISPFFLFPKQTDGLLFDLTLLANDESIDELCQKALKTLKDKGIPEKHSIFTTQLIDEMVLYTRNHCGPNQCIDILVRHQENSIKIDFRSIGQPFNPLNETNIDDHYNVTILNGLSQKISYEYAMGLNTTTILLNARS